MLKNLGVTKRLYLGFGAIVITPLILVSITYSHFSAWTNANRWNIHSYQVLVETGNILKSLIDMETCARGFTLTVDE